MPDSINRVGSRVFGANGEEASDPQLVMALRVQRAWRARRFMWTQLAPLLFSRTNGTTAVSGNLIFDSEVVARLKPYIIISDQTSPALLTQLFVYYWEVPRPGVIVSLNGSAQDIKLGRRVKEVFDNAIVSVSSSVQTCFLTAGTDAGVSKLVADIINKYEIDVPVIGVPTLETVAEQETLYTGFVPGTMHRANYPAGLTNDQWSAKLNPHHTHFIIVESGWKKSSTDKAGCVRPPLPLVRRADSRRVARARSERT